MARGGNQPASDIDIMVAIDPDAHIAALDHVGLKDDIAGLVDGLVDVVSRDHLKSHVAPTAGPSVLTVQAF